MENFENENMISSKNGKKPYERKIRINQMNPKKYEAQEEDEDKKEDEKIINQTSNKFEIQNQGNSQMNFENKEDIQEYTNLSKREFIQNNQNNNFDNMNNIQQEQLIQDNNLENNEFIKEVEYNNQRNYDQSELNNRQFFDNQDNPGNDDQFQYEEDEKDIENEKRNNDNKYNYKYKYKKIKTTENNIEHENDDDQNEDGGNENEEDEKEEDDNFDYQQIKKKPGKILHQSVHETFDEEGNRIVTTKTIKEFKQMTGGVRIRNIQNEKEKIEYERYKTNKGYKNKKFYIPRKTNSTNRIHSNKGDRVYLLAQLAKLKNEQEKNKKNQLYNNSQSPIIIHESDGYDNQNSIFSNELIEGNSFDEEIN